MHNCSVGAFVHLGIKMHTLSNIVIIISFFVTQIFQSLASYENKNAMQYIITYVIILRKQSFWVLAIIFKQKPPAIISLN